MGIGDIFKRRRKRESALSPELLDSVRGAVGSVGADRPEREGGPSKAPGSDRAQRPEAAPGDAAEDDERRPVELPGADAGELGAMLRRAVVTGLPQVSVERHEADLSGADLGEEMLSILSELGLGGESPARRLDRAEARRLNERVRDALRRAGIDPDSGEPL